MRTTNQLILNANAPIDLQIHTTYSDGQWMPEQLLDHLVREQFALVAITDHDRPDTAPALQQLAQTKGMPVLPAAEMTTTWQGGMVDVLCFGFEPGQQALTDLARELVQRQQENTCDVYARLCHQGYLAADRPERLRAIIEQPSARQPHALVAEVRQQCADIAPKAAGRLIREAGGDFATNDLATVVEAAHRSGAICVIAHPGRDDGFICFDAALLDQLRSEVPIDGLEAYYPTHTPEQTASYAAYAAANGLLLSAGSDSHSPERGPIKYPAHLCRALLERLNIHLR